MTIRLRSSLRTQLRVSLLVLPVVVLAVGYLEARHRHARASQQVLAEVEELAHDLSREHATVMKEARDLLTVLAAVPALREPESCRQFLVSFVDRFPQYANVGVAEPDGRIRCSGRGAEYSSVSVADRPYIQEARQTGDFAVSDYQIGRLTGLPSVSVAYPEQGGDGIVFAAVDLGWLGDALGGTHFPEGTQFLLTDANQRVLATHPYRPDRVGELATHIPLFAALHAGGEEVIQARGQDGVDRLLASAPLEGTGADQTPEVLVAAHADAAFAGVRRDFARDLTTLGLIVLLGLTTVTAADALLLRPLDDVARAARRVGSGDLGARTGVAHRTGTVGTLATAFDEMACAVEEKVRHERHQATHDAITGLPNRTALREYLDACIEDARGRGGSVAVLLVIVNRFHEIVNTLGHPTGDTLLRQIGPRLREAVGPDVMIARVGGAEFATVLPCGADDPEVFAAAHRMHEVMLRPFPAGSFEVEPGGSVGISAFPEHDDDPDRLVQRAGVAAVSARRSDAEMVVYSSAVDPYTSRRLRLIGGLRSGLQEGEMSVVFQPKVDLRTGRPAGAEALVRWRHPELGLVSPLEFIGLAEQTGAIRPLTRWVVQEAAAYSRSLADAGTPVRISANLSVRDLTDPGFARQIADIMASTGVAPEYLELEVTESLLMSDPALARATLTELRAMGLTLSIDDFGTGFCSLSYLRDLPVNVIKIDKCFIAGGPGPLHDAAITRSVIELGHNLGLEVLAEGVSTELIEQALREIGCDIAQGDLYGRPMDGAAFSRWLRSATETTRTFETV